jgi:hypothetical protein
MTQSSPPAARRMELKAGVMERDGHVDADGSQRVPCGFCGTLLRWGNMTLDRYPIPGRKGGTYALANVRAACWSCNTEDGAAGSGKALFPGLLTKNQRRRFKRRQARERVKVRLTLEDVFTPEELAR